MIISKSKKFIFAKVRCTASYTMHKALVEYDDTEIPVKISMEGESDPHAPFWDICKKFHNHGSYFKFCFVRNPWDAVVSKYAFWSRCRKNLDHWTYRFYDDKPFSSFDNYVKTPRLIDCCEHVYPVINYYDFIHDADGNMIPNQIYKYEELEKSYADICTKLDIPANPLREQNRVYHEHYSKYYNDELIEIVRERYKWGIEHFNYRFEKA